MAGVFALQAEVIGHDVGELGVVVVDEEVEPAVVVEVPEPAGERPVVARPGDAHLAGDVAERAVPLVVVQPAGRVEVRDEEVEPAVAVVVAPGRPLGHALVDDAGRGGDVLERAVALVVVEPAAVGGVGRFAVVLAADEEVERGRRRRNRPRRPIRSTAARPGRWRWSRPRRSPPPLFRRSESRADFSQAPRSSRTSGLPSLS